MNRNIPYEGSSHISSAQDVSGNFPTGTASMLTSNNGNLSTSPPDIRRISDDRIHPQRGRQTYYETTSDGNVLIVQPSFDDSCNKTLISPSKSPEDRACTAQVIGKEVTDEPGRSSSPHSPTAGFVNDKHSGRHTRDLSAHFFDATTLNRDGSNDSGDNVKDGQDILDTRKHRRLLSGDGSNPSMAHRRLNSLGNSAPVQRRRHHREPSVGLDILSAAADFSREELAREADKTEQAVPFTRTPLGPRSFPSIAHHMPPPQTRRYSCVPEGILPPPSEYGYLPYHPSYQMYNGRPDMHQYPVQYPMQHPVNKPPVGFPELYHSKANDAVPARVTQGSQTFVTAMSVGGNKAIRPNVPVSSLAPIPSQIFQHHHHRRMSSFSSLGIGTIFGGSNHGTSPEKELSHPLKDPLKDPLKHHRSTSSSVSFLNALDVAGMNGNADDTFLRNLQESTSAYVPAFCKPCDQTVEEVTSSASQQSSDSDQPKKLASGGTSKRIRRKCTIPGCLNRVVQGGLCISHGAKRKTCNYPGCMKNVKKAGLCSTHGPARKRCDTPGCPKVAVQGGRCIAHGAKKKLCSFANCSKQAILAGMCKKHHDQSQGDKKTSHNRGLSIFHDISADAVQCIINADTLTQRPAPSWQP